MINPHTANKFPFDDEALSSWINRRLGQLNLPKDMFTSTLDRDYPDVAQCLKKDPDFPEGGIWRGVLTRLLKVPRTALDRIGLRRSPWMMRPACRHSVCFQCLAEAPSPAEQYARETWMQSWRTTCDVHFTPLVRAPAVGWGWADIRYESRRMHGAMMRLPGRFAKRNSDSWQALQGFLREAVFSSERYMMSDWAEHFERAKGGEIAGAMLVWSDLLSCVSQSWLPFASPMIASFGLPVALSRATHFRCPNVLSDGSPPAIGQFCAMDDPSARRTCLVVAVDAMYDISRIHIVGAKRQPPTWGWPKLLQEMPSEALSWLIKRAERWPNVWQSKAAFWGQRRY